MEAVVTIGLDIAKSVFQVHGVDANGAVVVRRRLTRAKVLSFFERLPPCLVGLEACATATGAREVGDRRERAVDARASNLPLRSTKTRDVSLWRIPDPLIALGAVCLSEQTFA